MEETIDGRIRVFGLLAAVRLTDGKEDVLRRIQKTEKGIPAWAKANPVCRIVQVEIREISE